MASFCNRQKLTQVFTLGIPDFDDMIEMLAEAVIHDEFVSEKLRSIKQIYSYLSSDFPIQFHEWEDNILGIAGDYLFYQYHKNTTSVDLLTC